MGTRRPLTLWPSLALVAVTAFLVGLPLRVEGFDVNPIWIAKASLPSFSVAVGLALILRLVLHRVREGAWPARASLAWRPRAAPLLGALAILTALLGIYCWGKLLIPWFRPGLLYDAQLHDLDVMLHLGLDPGMTLLAALEGARWLDVLLDAVYAQYPLVLLGVAAWFLTQPDDDDRHRWLRGFVLLWLGGLALYWLVPSLGPAFVFPDLAPILSKRYPLAFATEGMLLANYQSLEALLRGTAELPLRIEHGIAAFPSLHVAVPAHAWLFASERKHPLRGPLLALTIAFVLGSIVTGWHYLVDAWAGLLLAALCWAAYRKPRAAAVEPDA